MSETDPLEKMAQEILKTYEQSLEALKGVRSDDNPKSPNWQRWAKQEGVHVEACREYGPHVADAYLYQRRLARTLLDNTNWSGEEEGQTILSVSTSALHAFSDAFGEKILSPYEDYGQKG